MGLRRVSTAGGALLASFAARGRTQGVAGLAVALEHSVVLSGGQPLRSSAAELGARSALGRPVLLLPGGLQWRGELPPPGAGLLQRRALPPPAARLRVIVVAS